MQPEPASGTNMEWFEIDDWLLYSIESPNSGNARGVAQGHIYTRTGTLIASVVQEGLVRPLTK